MDLVEAAANFDRATRHCDNLIEVHRGHGGASAGRRDKEVSLNRAIVILTVASWQALVQDLTLAALDLAAPAAGSPLSPQAYALIAGRVKKEVGDFATPNAENTRRLLQGAGFDPLPHWTWKQQGGKGIGVISWTSTQASARINEWLKLRHAIAHGHLHLPNVAALQAVRDARVAKRPDPVDPSIRLVDAEACLSFFRRLEGLTGNALASHLGLTWR